ncbi:MAG TPA: hypothetical protein VK590_06580, partial [Saprospiraceae bacterium]|nr:hypothetical protein [Saprospiraceae bacterium]
MKKLCCLLFISFMMMNCKKEVKELLVNTWRYDTDRMYKVTAVNLKDHPIRDTILKAYKDKFLTRYNNSSFKFEKSGAFTWDEQGRKHIGSWALADHDSTIVTKTDTVSIEYNIVELKEDKMIWDDHARNTDPKFKLSRPI